jgi:hypothetical protein
MKRREFLTHTMLAGAAGLLAPVPRIFAASADSYTGPLLVTLQVDGGWDVTSFCDPKVNQPGEQEITTWSNTMDIQTAGNINYAPFANNAGFFDKYFQDMLVINGVDVQTNSHTTGVLHNWSGRNSEGFPSMTAMFAAHHAPEQPLSYVNSGGFSQTADLIRFSRLEDVGALRQILAPEVESIDAYIRSPADMARIREYRNMRIARMIANPANLARTQLNLEAYESALLNKSALTDFEAFIPADDEIYPVDQVNTQVSSNLRRQIQMMIAAFQAGIGSAADLFTSGYDTHTNHDALHEPLFAHLTDSIDLLWTLAGEAGLADRLTVVIGSDFSRTPYYNSDNGKDHWPISSFVVMEQNPVWGNRVVGVTDEAHNALTISPLTMQPDAGGTTIYPKHVHKAIRRYLGLENTTVDANFAFTNTEDFDFFG